MAVLGIGIDLVEVERIRQLLEKHGERFRSKTFTQNEILYCDSCGNPAMHYAARFAAKEAVAKALGTGLWAKGVDWKDIEVTRNAEGCPEVTLTGGAFARMRESGGTDVLVSLTHTADLASAYALIQRL